jgi:hypothetical protein
MNDFIVTFENLQIIFQTTKATIEAIQQLVSEIQLLSLASS